MFSINDIYGTSLPEKTLCLTFDDGPGETIGDGSGPKTLKLAKYLREQDIYATFFMVGKFIIQYPQILPEVSKLGHIIGNHTFNHPHSTSFYLSGGDIVSEIKETDNLIKSWVSNNTIYFRAPYGDWSSVISEKLNQSLGNELNHVGPFKWDIDCGDWDYWNRGQSAEDCASSYLNKITQIGRGIVLMHDSTADLVQARMNNLTYETISILIPKLKQLGYKFVRLDDITL